MLIEAAVPKRSATIELVVIMIIHRPRAASWPSRLLATSCPRPRPRPRAQRVQADGVGRERGLVHQNGLHLTHLERAGGQGRKPAHAGSRSRGRRPLHSGLFCYFPARAWKNKRKLLATWLVFRVYILN